MQGRETGRRKLDRCLASWIEEEEKEEEEEEEEKKRTVFC